MYIIVLYSKLLLYSTILHNSVAGVGVDSSKDSSYLLPCQRSDRTAGGSREGEGLGLGLLLNGSHVGGIEGGGGGGEGRKAIGDVSGGGRGGGAMMVAGGAVLFLIFFFLRM